MTSPYDFAKLRAIDVKPIEHQGAPAFYLRDPWELAEGYAVVPSFLGIILAGCDGEHTVAQLQADFEEHFGIAIDPAEVEHLLSQLDDIYLLDNDRSRQVIQATLAEYRAAPFRPPALAGLSYPADPAELRREFQAYIDELPPLDKTQTKGERGLFSPHIDYMRGGPVYADVWRRVRQSVQAAEVVVIFGTDHSSPVAGSITPTYQNYATPFGVLPTDSAVVDAVVNVIGADAAFAEELNHRREHSLELVLTWLHFMRNGQPVPVVPILTGSFHHFVVNGHGPNGDDRLHQVIHAIRQATAGRNLFVIASGDLAHLGPAFNTDPIGPDDKIRLKADDQTMLAPLIAGDADSFFEIIRTNRGERNVCGTAPFYLSLKLMGDEPQGALAGYDCCVADDEETSFVSICGMTFV